MSILSNNLVCRKPITAAVCSAPSGAQSDVVAASTPVEAKWLAGIANRIATLRPENVQPQAQVQTTRLTPFPAPGAWGPAVHPVNQRLLVDDYVTTSQTPV